MGGRILQFAKDKKVAIETGLLLALVASVFFAGAEFTKLKAKIDDNWSYRMEREAWREFEALNRSAFPGVRIPDAFAIRRDHTSSVVKESATIVSQNR